MLVINLFGGPGCGKSTLSADLFANMKRAGLVCELVTEYAKDMVYEDNRFILNDQLYVLAQQNKRVSRLNGKVDYVITDSPILTSLFYYNRYNNLPKNQTFCNLVEDVFNSYHNYNIQLKRSNDVSYQQYGRLQNNNQAKEIDKEIEDYLQSHNLIDLVLYPMDNKVDFNNILWFIQVEHNKENV